MIESIASAFFSQVHNLSSFCLSSVSEPLNALTDRIADFSAGLFQTSAFFITSTSRSFRERRVRTLLFDALNIFFALAVLSGCSADELEDVLERSWPLITNDMRVVARLRVMAAIARMSPGQRRSLSGQQLLVAPNRQGFTRVVRGFCLSKRSRKKA